MAEKQKSVLYGFTFSPQGIPQRVSFLEVDASTIEAFHPKRKPKRGRKKGSPFATKAACLEYLRMLAGLCRKNDMRVSKAQLGLLCSARQRGKGSYIVTEDPHSAGRTITRWCVGHHIDFEKDVKKYHGSN